MDDYLTGAGPQPVSSNGCCLAAGSAANFGITDLAGFGCQYQIPGYVDDENYLQQEQLEVDDPSVNGELLGCDDIDNVNQQYEYADSTSIPAWPATNYSGTVFENGAGIDITASHNRVTQQDVQDYQTNIDTLSADNVDKFVWNAVDGGLGDQFPPQGVTSGFGSSDFSGGEDVPDSYDVFISQVVRGVPVEHERTTELQGIRVEEYRPSPSLLDGDAEGQVLAADGGGTPYQGVTSAPTFLAGFPVYVSRPNFLYGNATLYDQDGNLKLYATAASYGAQAASLDVEVEIDEAYVLAHEDDFDTYLQIEPATGKTFAGHKRLQASFSVWNCDPNDADMPACALGVGLGSTMAALGMAPEGWNCWTDTAATYFDTTAFGIPGLTANVLDYACSSANAFTPFVKGDVIIPQYWMDEQAEMTVDLADDFKYYGLVKQLTEVGLVAGAALGTVMMAAGTVVWRRRMQQSKSY
jgi:hypothetical protein